MPSKQRQTQTRTAGSERVTFDGEGWAVEDYGADRPRTSEAHGRHVANAVIAATSSKGSTGR